MLRGSVPTASVGVTAMSRAVPLTCLVLLAVGQAAAAPGENLLQNGGFEEAFSDAGVPAGWQAYGGGAADTSLSLATVAHDGPQALLISDHNPAQEVGVSQTAELPPDARFLVASVHVRAAEDGRGAGGFLQLRFLPSQKLLQVGLSGSADGWRPCRVAGEAPEGTTAIQVFLYTHRETICDTLVDDAQVIAVASREELLESSDTVDLSSFPPPPVERLKDLHLTTAIVSEGKPVASVVVPQDGRYDALAGRIVDAIAQSTAARVPVKRDSEVTLPLPENTVILGNRSTNTLISRLYDLYYTYLDLKYPGAGGYLVRSLHNPFGNGQNAILVGSSDDAGMERAVAELISLATSAARGDSLALGWTLRVQLAEGLEPPEDADQAKAWEESLMYPGATYFGWNSLSRRLALYHMTGNERFLQEFLRLAFPDEEAKKFLWKVDGERIEDKDHPLSGPYHYNAHHMMLLWDLVEESPFFTDEQRLRVTQAFAEQLRHWQAEWAYAGRHYGDPDALIGTRHDQWAAVSLYALSRYFQKYYPNPVWERNQQAVQDYFGSFARTFHVAGELDHLWWYTTSYEPLVAYMVLSGDRRGVDNGNLETLMRGYDLLVQGRRDGPYVRQFSLTMAHRCAYLTGDGRYLYYRDLTSLDTNVFRIGQSFWPTIAPRPPEELAYQALARPLSPDEARSRLPAVPYEQAFQFAGYRTGITDQDDYLLLDGFYGGSRNPYHCLALTELRHGPTTVLAGYLSQAVVRQSGLVEPTVPVGSALTRCAALGKIAHFEARVPDLAYGAWERRIVHVAGGWTLVVDEFVARDDVRNLDFAVQWELPANATLTDAGWIAYASSGTQAALIPWSRPRVSISGRVATCSLLADLSKGQRLGTVTLLGLNPADRGLDCARVSDRAALITDGGPLLAVWGESGDTDSADLRADLALLGSKLIYAADARRLALGAPLLQADKPVSVYWDLVAGTLDIECHEPTTVALAVADPEAVTTGGQALKPASREGGLTAFRLDQGRRELGGVALSGEATAALSAKLADLAATATRAPEGADLPVPADVPQLEPDLTATVEGGVQRILPGPGQGGPSVYAVAGGKAAYPVAADGALGDPLTVEAGILSSAYWPEARLLLLGGKDDQVYAYDPTGRLRWTFQSVMHPDLYATGKTYWFKQDVPGISGLLTGGLVGDGTQAFVGSACTIEVLDENGQLLKRLPQYWGSVWRMALVHKPDGGRRLLAAKMPNGVNDIGIVDAPAGAADGDWGLSYGFTALPAGHTFIAGWSAMNTQDLIAADLEGDGAEEVVMDINGSWNRVCVYDALGAPKWALSFGPSLNYPHRYLRGLVVADLDGNGKPEVIAATKDRIVAAFDAEGGRLWTAVLPSASWTLAAVPVGRGALVAAGCEDGSVLVIDAAGKLAGRAALEGRVEALLAGREGGSSWLWAGTSKGILARLAF